jgi:phage terminase large subunit-like protein
LPNEQAVLGSQPLTLEHFREWASHLVLDNGEKWVLEPFQADFYGDVLERWGQPCEDWLIVPEGNGKSTSLSGFALYVCAFSDDAFIPVAASSRDQAKIIYRQAKGFVRRTWGLDDGPFRCFDGYRRITYRAKDSQFEIFAADDRTGDGIIPKLALIDELHRHRTMDLYQTWRGKLDKLNAHLMVISTAGEPGGEFEEARERMRQEAEVVERTPGRVKAISPSFVLHDWAVAEDGDADDLVQVKAANPFSGITTETLGRKKASPTMTPQHWRRFVCNLPTRSDYAAIQESEWFGAQVDDRPPAGEPIWLGLDLGWKWDTTAAVPLWWKSESITACFMTRRSSFRRGMGRAPTRIRSRRR